MSGSERSRTGSSWAGPSLRELLESRDAWRRDSHLPLARTPGGQRLHRPDCTFILSTIRIAEDGIAWREDRDGATVPNGNVPYPRRAAGDRPTCGTCRGDA